MPPLMNLPAYSTPNALINFDPMVQGIDAYQKGAENVRRVGVARNAGNALMSGDYAGAMSTAMQGDRPDLAGLAMQAKAQASQEQSQALDREHKTAMMMGGVAQRVLDMHKAGDTAGAQTLYSRIAAHPNMAKSLTDHGIDPNDHLGASQFIMAQAAGYRNPLDDEMKRAQIGMTNAHAGAYRAMSAVRDAQANVNNNKATLIDPTENWGLDSNNRLVRLGAGSRGGPVAAPPITEDEMAGAPQKRDRLQFSGANNPYGPTGRTADTVPGVVVNGKGGSDRYASEQLAGQQSLESVESDRRARLQQYMQQQQALKAVNGGRDPPSGSYWTGPGTYASGAVKDTATERAMRLHARQGMETLSTAEKLLESKGVLDDLKHIAGDNYKIPGTSMSVGGFGEKGRGYRAAESAVLQLNFSLSGKSVSNAEREHFMRLYMPSAFDSADTQKWKIGQIKTFFQAVLDARQRGMDEDQIAAMYRVKLAEGEAGPQPGAAAPAKPDFSKIPTDELLKRLR